MTSTDAHPPARRSRRVLVIAFVLAVLLAVATAVTWSVVAANDRSKAARVGDDGLSMSVADTRISAPAGVAPEGTTVTAAATTADVSAAVFGAATPLHEGVEISLEGGVQPQKPVQMEFRIPADVPVPDEDTIFVLAYSDGQENPDILPARWDPELRTVSTTVTHFSTVQTVSVDQNDLIEGFTAEMGKAFASRTEQPACYGKDPLDGDGLIVVTPFANDAVWPCVSLEGDTLVLELHNNAPLIWTAVSDPKGFSGTPNASTIAGSFTMMVHPMIETSRAMDQHLLLQEETARIEYDLSELPVTGRLDAMPALMLASIAVGAAVSIAPDGIKWLELLEAAECLGAVAKVIVEDSSPMEVLQASVTCVGAVAGTAVGQVFALLMEHPTSLNGAITGAIGEVTGDTHIPFEVKLNVPATASRLADGSSYLWEVPSSGGMLSAYPSGDGVDSLVVSDGAAELWASSTSQWVGCNGDTSRTRYRLDGEYTALAATAALRTGTPEGLTARFEFEVDGEPVHTSSVTNGAIGDPFNLDLTGADELVVTASTSDECTDEKTGYGVLRATVTGGAAEDVDTSELVGSWAGTVEQGNRTYGIEAELTANDGVLSGKVSYPELECSGTWSQERIEGGAVVLAEEISAGAGLRCAREVEVRLYRTSAGATVKLLAKSGTTATAKVTRE